MKKVLCFVLFFLILSTCFAKIAVSKQSDMTETTNWVFKKAGTKISRGYTPKKDYIYSKLSNGYLVETTRARGGVSPGKEHHFESNKMDECVIWIEKNNDVHFILYKYGYLLSNYSYNNSETRWIITLKKDEQVLMTSNTVLGVDGLFSLTNKDDQKKWTSLLSEYDELQIEFCLYISYIKGQQDGADVKITFDIHSKGFAFAAKKL